MDLQTILAALQGGQGPGGMMPGQMDPQMRKLMEMLAQQQRMRASGLQDGPVAASPEMAAAARPPMPPQAGGGMPAGPGMPMGGQPRPAAPMPGAGAPGQTLGGAGGGFGARMAQQPDLMSLLKAIFMGGAGR